MIWSPLPPIVAATAPLARLGPVLREIARGGLAGVITGIVMGGVGGRIAMRVASIIDGAEHSIRTENGAVIGEFTLEGTLELVIFAGIFTGIGMAVIWVIVQRWLPVAGAARYLAAGVVGVAMGGRFAIDGRNFDFVILDPALGQASIFIVLAALTGAAIVGIDAWLERRLPSDQGPAIGVYAAISLLGLAIAVPSMVLFFRREDCSCVSPPRLVGAVLLAVGMLTVMCWVRSVRGSRELPWTRRAGLFLVILLVVAGLIHLGGEIAHFA